MEGGRIVSGVKLASRDRVADRVKVWSAAAAAAFLAAALTGASALGRPTPPSDEVELSRARVTAPSPEMMEAIVREMGFDEQETLIDGRSAELIITPGQWREMEHLGCAVALIEHGRPMRDIIAARRAPRDNGPEYPDLAEVIAQMQDAAATYPAICEFVDLTDRYGAPPTFEGRHLYAVKISDNVGVDEDEPAVQIVGAHHARELVTPVIALLALDNLVGGYAGDPAIRALVDSHEIWIAPVWNPDGYHHVFTVNNLWRKNRRVFQGGIGCDQNRNYPLGWYAACSGSTSPSNETYKGPNPGSEAETITMMLWSQAERFAKLIDYHSSGRETLYAYNCNDHPFQSYLAAEADALTRASGYVDARAPSAEGEHYQWQAGMLGTHAFLIETHTEFQPTYESAVLEAQRVWPGIVWMLEHHLPLTGRVTQAGTDAPLEAAITPLGVNYALGESNSSDPDTGRYYAPWPAGAYDVLLEAPGHQSRVVPITVVNGAPTVVDVALSRTLIAFEFPNGVPTTIHPRLDRFALVIRELEPGALRPETATLHYGPIGGPHERSPLVHLGGEGYLAVFPLTGCGERVAFWLSAEDVNGVQVVSPPGAPADTYSALSATGVSSVFTDNFETDRGWTTSINGATGGQWQRGVPVNDPNWAYDPETDGDGSGQAFLTQNEPGNTDVDNGSVTLSSPIFDLSSGGASLSYDYYLNLTNGSGADMLLVEMSSSGTGGPWREVVRHTSSGGLAWRTHTITQADLDAAGINMTSNMAMRFTANDANPQSIVEAGVDGVVIEAARCDPFPVLAVGPLVGGQRGEFEVTRAAPGGLTYLIYSLRGYGTTVVPPLGVTLDLAQPAQAGTAVRASSQGVARWNLPIPGVHNVTVWFQAAQQGRTSNVVRTVVQ